MIVAGVDSSTQSTKVELRDVDRGEVVARASASHPPTEPPVSEQDPGAWWAALVECFDRLGEQRREVAALAVGAQQHGLVLVGVDGHVVRPAKLWNDTTSAPQADRLVALVGAEAWARSCGSVPVPAFTVTKLAWVAEHEPELLDLVELVQLPHDHLTWRLTGRSVTDRGDASGTGWFDPVAGGYRADLLALAGDGLDAWVPRLPTVLEADEAAGTVSAEAAAALGLGDGVVVGPGTGDNMAAALGLGLEAGDVVMSLGTSGTVYGVSERATADPSGAVAGFADATGRFLPLVCTLNATKVTDTVARWLGTDAPGLAELALAAGPAAGPVLVPYFDGERTPNLPDASGTLIGLRNDTSREALALAAHDGVLCGLFGGLDALDAAGVHTGGRLLLIGGGARSEAYRVRAAALRGGPVLVPDDDETVATGAAVQAAWVLTGRSPRQLAADWGLGAGSTVDPPAGVDGADIRARFHAAAASG